MRRAAIARDQKPKIDRPYLDDHSISWIKRKAWTIIYTVTDLLKNPAYAIPLLLNISGGALFFLIIGQAELSLTVPITNSLAFLFTVLGEWWADGKVISRGTVTVLYMLRLPRLTSLDTWLGMVLVLGGIALCVIAKSG